MSARLGKLIRVKPARYPLAAEIQYYRVLKRLINDFETATLYELRQNGQEIILAADRDFGRIDAVTFLVPIANGFVSYLTRMIERIVQGMTSSLLTALDEIQVIRSNANGMHKREWGRQLREAYNRTLAVNILNNEPDMSRMLNAWEQQNVELIKSIPQTIAGQLRNEFTQAFVNGTNMKDLTKIVKDRTGVADSRAALIARDQIGKLNGQLSAMRQKAAGIDSYIWRTMRDERVRPKHRARDGKTYRWDNPTEIKPGQEIRCRCVGDPVFPPLQLASDPSNIGSLE